MKNKMRFLSLGLIVLFLGNSGVPNSTAVVEGKVFLIYSGGSFPQNFTNFQDVYNVNNSLRQETIIDFSTNLADVDALFLTANSRMTSEDFSAISTWFSNGNKLLWVAGDSDFGGFFIAQDLNPVLAGIESVLRLDAGAVDDPVSNDGASYRVVADHAGSGPIATVITAEITNVTAPFHAPTSVYYVEGGVSKDLRTSAPIGVEALIFASAEAIVLDQDVSLTDGDFYLTQATTGNYPLIAVEIMDRNMVVVSGETVIGNYKEMYADTFEISGNPHTGKAIIDNLIAYYYNNVYDVDFTTTPNDFIPPSTVTVTDTVTVTKTVSVPGETVVSTAIGSTAELSYAASFSIFGLIAIWKFRNKKKN